MRRAGSRPNKRTARKRGVIMIRKKMFAGMLMGLAILLSAGCGGKEAENGADITPTTQAEPSADAAP